MKTQDIYLIYRGLRYMEGNGGVNMERRMWVDKMLVRIGKGLGIDEETMWDILEGLGWWHEGEITKASWWVDLACMMIREMSRKK